MAKKSKIFNKSGRSFYCENDVVLAPQSVVSVSAAEADKLSNLYPGEIMIVSSDNPDDAAEEADQATADAIAEKQAEAEKAKAEQLKQEKKDAAAAAKDGSDKNPPLTPEQQAAADDAKLAEMIAEEEKQKAADAAKLTQQGK